MGELGISVVNLGPCSICGCNQPLIFQEEKSEKWFVSCGKKVQCGNETKKHKELLEAASEWGIIK